MTDRSQRRRSSEKLKIVGSVVGTRLVDGASPIAYGYGEKVAAYCDNGPVFSLSSIAGSRRRRRLGPEMSARPTGRGSKDDPDFAVGADRGRKHRRNRKPRSGKIRDITDEQRHNNPRVIPPAMRARVVLRYADAKDLLISGLVEGGGEIAQHPAVVDTPFGKGHVVMFSINPVWRGETQGTYSLVLNTVMNYDSLNAGRKDDQKVGGGERPGQSWPRQGAACQLGQLEYNPRHHGQEQEAGQHQEEQDKATRRKAAHATTKSCPRTQ